MIPAFSRLPLRASPGEGAGKRGSGILPLFAYTNKVKKLVIGGHQIAVYARFQNGICDDVRNNRYCCLGWINVNVVNIDAIYESRFYAHCTVLYWCKNGGGKGAGKL